MSDSTSFTVEIILGRVELRPGKWVRDEQGRYGQQYERIDYAADGRVKERKTIEPACWISYG